MDYFLNFLILLVAVALFVFLIRRDTDSSKQHECKTEEEKDIHMDDYSREPEHSRDVPRWDKIKPMGQRDRIVNYCPRCGYGILVYSETNISLRTGSTIEYYYCMNCQMDTAYGRVL